MFTNGSLQLPPPQVIIFTALKNIQAMSLTLEHLFDDPNLSVEPILFQFSQLQGPFIIFGDSEYNLNTVIECEPESKNGKLIMDSFIKEEKKSNNEKMMKRI